MMHPHKTRWAALAALLLALSITAPAAAQQQEDSVEDGLENEGCAVTPGGYGAPPEGNNPSALLHAHFDDVFGDNLTVNGHVFEDAQEVTDTLVVEGDPLFNHAVALAINLAFGAEGLLNGTLEGVEVDGGPYDGLTAEELLALAEDALEDPDRTTAEYSDLIDALTGLNEEAFGCNAERVPPPPPTEGEVPCPPILEVVAHANRTIEVDWGAVENASEYRVYSGLSADNLSLAATTNDTVFFDENLTVGQTYFYMVTAVVDGVESENCEVVSATAIPFFPGFAVAAVAVLGTAGAVAAFRRR